MRNVLAPLIHLCLAATCVAQVRVDHPIMLNSTDTAERMIGGIARANDEHALITLGDARSGAYHWAQASGTNGNITLSLDPVATGYVNGLSIRFLPAVSASGVVTFNVDGLGPKPVYRTDGQRVVAGQVQPGTMVEAIYADSAFFLQGRAPSACPDGFLQANTSFCLMRNDTLNMSIYNAANWCYSRGARLCSWDEYISACTVLQGQLEGMYDDWEWIDGTADHTHTAVQAGRYACRSERSWGALESNNNYARVRCCYSLR
jgi:hypothetical protein